MKKFLVIPFFFFLYSPFSQADTFIVPDDHPTIQAAIDQAVSGDSILIRPGIYYENLHIEYKGLLLSVYDGFSLSNVYYQAVIDGQQQDYAIDILNCDDTVTLKGLTFCNGYGEHAGGIRCGESNLKLEYILVRDNSTWMSAAHGGGGVTVANSSYLKMSHVTITGNRAYNFGGGLKLRYDAVAEGHDVVISGNTCGNGGHSKGGGISLDYNSHLYLYRSVISDNYAYNWGGAVAMGGNGFSSVRLVNVTITGNHAGIGGGAIYACYEDNRVFLGNCILTNNWGDLGMNPIDQEVFFDEDGWNNELAYCYSDILGGLINMVIPDGSSVTELEGNADAVPYYHKDLSLLEFSPCIDAGTDHYTYWDEELINIPPDQYHGAMPDMGAYENFDVQVGNPERPPTIPAWLDVYPNPSGGILNAVFTYPPGNKADIALYDAQGKLMMEQRHKIRPNDVTTITIDTGHLSPGMYIFKGQCKGSTVSKKVILE